MSGSEAGPDAEMMMPSKEGSGWRPPREPSVRVPGERMRDAWQKPARWTIGKLLGGRFGDE